MFLFLLRGKPPNTPLTLHRCALQRLIFTFRCAQSKNYAASLDFFIIFYILLYILYYYIYNTKLLGVYYVISINIFICATIIFILLSLLLFYVLCGTLSINYKAKGYIKLKTFKAFYEINPDRWTLYDDCINFHIDGWYEDTYCFHFIDYYRYQLWHYKIKKYDSQLETNKAYAKMIKIIKQDIADFEERNAAETKQKLNEIWKEK